jgi:hypothetical protein
MPQYSEKWTISINREKFVIDGEEKLKLEKAMQNGDRWFKTKLGDILSVSHIESVVFRSKEIKNQLPTGEKKVEKPIPEEKWKQIKKEAYQKIGKSRGQIGT